ncbi:MAG: DUF4350 domain-containing protein [Ferruginibacter sp.]
MPDLKESFSYKDNRPFGTSVAYNMLKSAYLEKKIEVNKKPFADNYGWDYDTASLYWNISRNYYLNEKDAESLLSFIYKGNTAFISAANYDTSFLNKLFCKQNEPDYFLANNILAVKNTSVRFNKNLSLYDEDFSYFYLPFLHYFSKINGSYARIIGYNDGGKANFFVFMWGKGRIYFHNEPRALSNYFLLTNSNYLYLQEILQMMPEKPTSVYWDSYYSNRTFSSTNSDGKSTLYTLMKYPPLAKAFFIALTLLLLYIFFNSKRRQRIVPVIKPSVNTSIAFAEAIAGLYLQKKDNKIIAEKIITYFNEYVRTKLFLNIHVSDVSYAPMLSRKSGVELCITEELSKMIVSINKSDKVSDEQLLTLNGLTEIFFKNKL